MSDKKRLFGPTFLAGLKRGLGTAWFLTRIMVPLSAGVAVLQWTGALAWLAGTARLLLKIYAIVLSLTIGTRSRDDSGPESCRIFTCRSRSATRFSRTPSSSSRSEQAFPGS